MADPGRVIVTGGTGALGRAVVAQLLYMGARVAVSWRDAPAWRDLEKVSEASASLRGFEADLGEAGPARGFVEEAVDWLEGLDGLALVAGGWAGGRPFEQAPETEWDDMVTANLHTAAHVCRAALPHLLVGGGSVVTVGAGAALSGGAGMAGYAVAKSGLHALTRVLAAENRERGVRFNGVLPGIIDTPANRQAMPGADRTSWTPPEDIARTIAYLLSSESSPLSGALLPMEGAASGGG